MSSVTPARLARRLVRGWKDSKLTDYLDRIALRVLSGRSPRVLVSCPPRHGKTTILGRVLPWLHLQAFPELDVLLTSGTASLAHESSWTLREWQKRYWNLCGHKLEPGRESLDAWKLTTGATLRAAGVGGGIVGHGASLLVLDDYCKNAEEADSPTVREKVHRWFVTTAQSRLTPDGKIVIIATRWHKDDLIGRLLDSESLGGQPWEVISLPALADVNDALGRSPGEALWPAEWPADKLRKLKDDLYSQGQGRYWSALYMGDPQAGDGSAEWPATYFQNIWADEVVGDKSLRILALDPRKGRTSTTGDYCSFADMTLSDGTVWVRCDLRRIPIDQIEDEAAAKLDTGVYDGFICESNDAQYLIAKNIEKKVKGRRVLMTTKESTGDKHVRIRLCLTPLLAKGKLKLMTDCPTNRLLLRQLENFPNDAHDDGPDSLVLGVGLLNHLMHGRQAPRREVLTTR